LPGHKGLDGDYIELLFIGLGEISRSNIDLDPVDGAGEWEGRFVVCADG
jgi:hypothetical protein